jgi:serine/threonine protein kinase
MLCGYLPFDDDPANPDGENITRLYKYILETKLDFPDHVSPSAKHLMKRILVPDPAKRATLREIIQHPYVSLLCYFLSLLGSHNKIDGSNRCSSTLHHP